KGTSQIDNMMMGTQAMYADGGTYFSDIDERLGISSIHYLFDYFKQYQKFFTGPVGRDINDNLIEQGLRILNDKRTYKRRHYSNMLSTRPIKTLEDLEGLQLRSFESEVYAGAYRALGANPTVIAWTELYLALQQNTVEAVTLPISEVW